MDMCISNLTVGINDETHFDCTFYTCLFSGLWILDMRCNPCRKIIGATTFECRMFVKLKITWICVSCILSNGICTCENECH